MSPHKTRFKTQGIPFCIHRRHHFRSVDIHAVKSHGQFIHKGNINIALRIFYKLSSFGNFNRRNRENACFNDQTVDSFYFFQSSRIHTRNYFSDIGQTMFFVTRIDALRRIGQLKIFTTDQSGLFSNDLTAYVFCYTGVNRRFKTYYGSLANIFANNAAGADNRLQVRRLIPINRCWYSHNNHGCLT